MSQFNFVPGEIISGGRGVAVGGSGLVVIAMAGNPDRMPAVGVVMGDYDSEAGTVLVDVIGPVRYASGSMTSGNLAAGREFPLRGKGVFLSQSGELVQLSGGKWSGGIPSGVLWQRLGVATDSGGMIANVDATVQASGGLVTTQGLLGF